MKTKDLLAGIAILAPFQKNPDGYWLGAEHDVLYAYATERPLPPEEVEKLAALGWTQEGAVRDGEWKPAYYDPSESWAAYV
jgi:hypothetical protein